MGTSFSSSSSSTVHPLIPPYSARVVHSVTAEIFEFLRPIKVVELLLEHPNHFVCPSHSLAVGHRFFPLSAHQDLLLTHSYILLPSPKLHSRISPEEMALLTRLVSKSYTGKVKTS